MAKRSFDRMRLDIGLLTACTAEENAQYSELVKNGEELPEGVFPSPDADDGTGFCKPDPTIPDGNEQLYALMRISRDLHFITALLKILLVVGVIGVIVLINILALR